MVENNNKDYAMQFVNNIENILQKAKYIGKWNWGNPAGQGNGLDTYELVNKSGMKVWCTIIEYLNAGTGEPNRCGVLATYPVDKKQSLGSILSVTIPYEFSKRFNSRAYSDGSCYELRNYGKITVGRTGIKRDNFFNYFDVLS